MRPLTVSVLTAFLTAFLLTACTGEIGTSGASGGDPTGPGGVPDVTADREGTAPTGESCTQLFVEPAPMQRLTAVQYTNTIRDLLGVDTDAADRFPPDDTIEGFEAGATISAVQVNRYADAAESVATGAVTQLGTLLPCSPAADGEAACASELIATLGRRAFRRSLTPEEQTGLEAVYDAGAVDGFDAGVRLMLEALLQSASFLYRVESVPADYEEGTPFPVTGVEMATRLSYFLWNSMPDDALLDAAESGALATPQDIEAQARRMVADPRARASMDSFVRQWLHLDGFELLEKDPNLFPEFDANLSRDMRASVARFVDAALWDEGNMIDALLLGDFAFVNTALAAVLDLDGVTSDELERRTLDLNERAGLLTQPGLLALLAKNNQTDPIHRGKFVREQLLCQLLPAPPDDIAVVAPDPAPGLTTRQRFAEHSENDACQGCHQLMDPIGFGFEAFDALGQFRTEEEGQPVDSTGELIATDSDGAFDGVVELAGILASSEEVRQCVARQVFRYALQRRDTANDHCGIEEVYARFVESDFDVRELLVQITQTDSFLYRIPAEEVAP